MYHVCYPLFYSPIQENVNCKKLQGWHKVGSSREHTTVRQGTQWTCPTWFQAWIAVVLHAHCLPKLTMASGDHQNRTSDEMIKKGAVKEGHLTSHSKSASWKKNKTSLLHNTRVLTNLLSHTVCSALLMHQGIVPFSAEVLRISLQRS